MPTPKPEPPAIESIKFSELVFDLLYSGRTKKEIQANAKDLAPQLADGWDSAQPGQYFLGEDGKKYVIAGFTRAEAAKLNDQKSGYFVLANGDAVSHLTACLRTNSGRPISRKAQGEVFAALAKGVVADDFAGAIADPKKKEDWKRLPMTPAEIGELPGVGRTGEHVRQCIMIAESSPEVAELIEADLVSLNIVVSSKSLAGDDDAKQLRILKKAIAFAKADGKEKATDQHFKQAKAELYPPKLIADNGEEAPKSTKGAEKQEKRDSGEPESKDEASSEPSAEPETTPEPEPSLFPHDKPVVFPKDGSKEDIRLRESIGAILLNPDNTENVTLDGDTVLELVNKIMEAIANKVLPI